MFGLIKDIPFTFNCMDLLQINLGFPTIYQQTVVGYSFHEQLIKIESEILVKKKKRKCYMNQQRHWFASDINIVVFHFDDSV